MLSNLSMGTVAVVGGDLRQRALYEYLCSLGAECELFGFSACSHKSFSRFLQRSNTVILPLPVTKDGRTVNADRECLLIELEDFVGLLHPGQRVFGGLIGSETERLFTSAGIEIIDYYKDEALILYNAELTAQGLLRVVLENITYRLRDSKILITGYGRVGKATARLFKCCGAEVSVAVRSSESRASAETAGLKALCYDRLPAMASSFDVVINSVAATVLGTPVLSGLKKGCLLLEAASAPYGFDLQAAKALSLEVKLCPGLPGRLLPESAGKAIGQTVINLSKGLVDR